MNELTHCLELGITGDLFLDEVYNRFDVMVGGAFDIFHALRVFVLKIIDDAVEDFVGMIAEGGHFTDCRVGSKML